MQNYTKMEESNMQQQSNITCQNFKKQQVAHIEFENEKQSLTTQIQG